MEVYAKQVDIRWSDLDPNFHLRHSVYYDWGAYCRLSFLAEHNVTPSVMILQHIGPIIFREECIFKTEMRFGDNITGNLKLDKCTADRSRWTMVHEVRKNDETRCAIITVDSAWLDITKRKLTVPGELIAGIFDAAVKTDQFKITDPVSK